MSWTKALQACPVLTSPSGIHCWQLSRQRCWAGWAFGPNPPLYSLLLQKPSSPSTTLSTSPSSPPLLCLGKSGWKNCNKYLLQPPSPSITDMELSSLFTQKALQGSLGLKVENLTAWLSAGAVNPCLKPLALWPSYHGILEWPGSEGTLNNHVPTPCHGQRRLLLDQVAPSPVWLYWTYHFYCLSPSSFMITSTKFH